MSSDTDVWARQVIEGKRKAGRAVPDRVNLETAITDIQIGDTMEGSSTVTLQVYDPDWLLLDSGFFDAGDDGKLDRIDVNWPDESRFWWRLTQTTMAAGNTVAMVFMEQAAAFLMAHHGPLKSSRAKSTRAEFLAGLVKRVKIVTLDFHCRELHQKQRIKKPGDAAERDKKKDQGLNPNDEITYKFWDGNSVTLSPQQMRNAETVLDEAFEHTDDERPLLALLEACITEGGNFNNPASGDASSVGILQLLDIHYGGSVEARRDIPRVVASFLEDGFAGAGGAIEVAKANPSYKPADIAQAVQAGSSSVSHGGARGRFNLVEDGARKVLEAYGGSGGGLNTRRKQYNFEIGTTENPHEDYWTGMQRLAQEVEWPLFIDGRDIYFDAETTLIRQKPAAVLRRNMPQVVDWSFTWDARNIATEMTLSLLCDPFEFRAGQVFRLVDFGPASTGSTAKLPGRWLVKDISRGAFDEISTFTLTQPHRPNPEPAPETVTVDSTTGGNASGPVGAGDLKGMTPKDVIDKIVLPIGRKHGLRTSQGLELTPANVATANAAHGPTGSGNTSQHQGPPNVAWAVDMSNGSWITPEMTAAAKEVAEALRSPWTMAIGNANSNIGGFRIQIIYNIDLGADGDHHNHVHVGVGA